LAVSGHGPGTAGPTASPGKTSAVASPTAAPGTAPATSAGKTRPSGPAAAKSPARTAPGSPTVDGKWTGTYDCSQGLTGVQLTITGSTVDNLMATVDFYPVAGNPGAADGSYELVGSYSAARGLVLNPDYWINEPAGYEMVGFSAPPPQANLMRGSVHGMSCSTFSVTK
ncbi:MAG: hypothetical protein M3Z75_19295, partial [Actinomycetota bacterium]|nr:hypothetical protein [Actinomycetota bacterium]